MYVLAVTNGNDRERTLSTAKKMIGETANNIVAQEAPRRYVSQLVIASGRYYLKQKDVAEEERRNHAYILSLREYSDARPWRWA